MVVLVEARALECDPDLAEDLRDVLLRACAAVRALRNRIVGEGLDLLELIAALLAPVLIGRHRDRAPSEVDEQQ